MPKKQKAYKNESALLYQYANRQCKDVSTLCRKRFSVLDGPPYANGEIHIGHIMNKLLKQIITLAQTQIGRRSALKTNWDCHGLPIELKVLKFQQNGSANFLCRVYALNWIKTQIAQFKLIGLKCYKPQTSMSASAQIKILNRLHDLIRVKRLAFGRKPVVWSLNENSAISENDTERKLARVKLADVLNVVASRVQTQQLKSVTIPKLLLMQLSKSYKLLGKMMLSTQSQVWSLPQTACLYTPNTNVFKIHNTKTISAHRTRFANTTQIKRAPSRLIRALNVLNVFNNTNVPIANWQSDNAQTIDLTARPNIAPKLAYSATPLPKRKGCALVGNAVEEIRVINKLITNALIISCYTSFCITFSSVRSKGPAVNWISAQLYVKLDQSARASVISAINSINFQPKACKMLLTKLVQTRPDWVISRQRRWGVPLCMVLNEHNKVALDGELKQRIKQLFRSHKENQWHKLKTLRDKYAKQNWRQTSDVIDVWFDASSVYSLRNNTSVWDLAIEGIDQHRGWFQSTLINSTLTANNTPIRAIITHGFAMCSTDQKLSKSLHSRLAQTMLKQLTKTNTNVLRLWSCVIRPFDNQIINANWLLKSKAVYIKINNTLKWGLNITLPTQLSNRLNQNIKLITPIDKLILHKLRLYGNRIILCYRTYDLNGVLDSVAVMCDSLLSMYFDFLKDQTYCDFNNTANRLNSIAVIKCAVAQVATWLTPIIPSVSYNLKTQLKLGNNVINTLPNKWFNRRTSLSWNVINKLKCLAAKLRTQGSNEMCINIYASDRCALRAFKNTNIALILGYAKANVVWINYSKPTAFIKLSKSLAVSVWQTKLQRCARCRRKLYFSEY
ncbi:MAG: Isoleucine--tRNA ligase [Candidatus Hodgkinia cicadicola]|nr:MAG: Isoleucine--tRNA ligase [Candidatus Hodgkinia cicadicola]